MDKIDPLTPEIPLEDLYNSYKEAAKADNYLFGDYNGYDVYREGQ